MQSLQCSRSAQLRAYDLPACVVRSEARLLVQRRRSTATARCAASSGTQLSLSEFASQLDKLLQAEDEGKALALVAEAKAAGTIRAFGTGRQVLYSVPTPCTAPLPASLQLQTADVSCVHALISLLAEASPFVALCGVADSKAHVQH